MSKCKNCGSNNGSPANEAPPEMDACGECPISYCDGCGETCKPLDCSCWVSLDGLSLADLKGVLALGDLSVVNKLA